MAIRVTSSRKGTMIRATGKDAQALFDALTTGSRQPRALPAAEFDATSDPGQPEHVACTPAEAAQP